MGIVAVDSSGIVGDPPINMVAVRLKNKQKHRVIFMNKNLHDEYRKSIGDDWFCKLGAALIFKSLETLIKTGDIIQIDTDFQGENRKRVEKYLKKMFGKHFYGTPLDNPKIQFIPPKYSEDVKEADRKSRLARHKKLERIVCPDLWGCLDYLD